MNYVQRVPPKPGPGKIPTWHKMDNMDARRTIAPCGILIRPHWKRQEEAPEPGQPACYRCFVNGRT